MKPIAKPNYTALNSQRKSWLVNKSLMSVLLLTLSACSTTSRLPPVTVLVDSQQPIVEVQADSVSFTNNANQRLTKRMEMQQKRLVELQKPKPD